MRAAAQVPDAAPPVPSINGSFVKLMSAVQLLNKHVEFIVRNWIAIQVGNITTNMKNVQRRILVKVIVFFIPVFVLIQAVLWGTNIKSAVNQTAAAVNAKVLQIPAPVLQVVLMQALMLQPVLYQRLLPLAQAQLPAQSLLLLPPVLRQHPQHYYLL